MFIFSFSYLILLGIFNAKTLVYDPMVVEIILYIIVKILYAIIITKNLNLYLKLSLYHQMKINEHIANLHFFLLTNTPTKLGMIINKCNKPFTVGIIQNMGCIACHISFLIGKKDKFYR